jgi:hypothetical protein
MGILLSHGIQPKLVFDGQRLEMKFQTHQQRSSNTQSRVLCEKIKIEIIKVLSNETKNKRQFIQFFNTLKSKDVKRHGNGRDSKSI